MLRTNLASSRTMRLGLLGLAAATAFVIASTGTADARKRKHRSSHHATAQSSYNPKSASIIVDAKSGAVLQSSNADAPRHPASLTKVMTLYLLFEQLDSGKLKLNSELEVSVHASRQSPTKLGLQPGQTITVENAIKGLVTRSANDAAVVVAEAIAGDEDDFARMMTRKARALGMSKTIYKNASGLPDGEQVTTARDQATLGRAIQDRFPKYYRYFSTEAFNYRGRVIRNHNRLLGRVEGVDGIKTGYTRASGFNLVTSMKRGNRYLVGVVMGGRSGGSRDAIMRNLLAEHLDEAATRRTVAAIVERNIGDAKVADARGSDDDDDAKVQAKPEARRAAPLQLAATASEPVPLPAPRAAANAAETADKPAPAPLTSGVIASQTLPAIPGSAEPMTPVRVKTVQVRMGQAKVASAAPGATAPVSTSAIPPARKPETAETSKAVVANAEAPAEARTTSRGEPWAASYAQSRGDFPAPLPTQPKTVNGIGQVVIGAPVPAEHAQAMAYADPSPRGAPPTSLNAQAAALQAATAAPTPAAAPQQPAPAVQHASMGKQHTVRSGWIIQVGALESESEARMRLNAARGTASKLLSSADPFTETVSKGNKTLYRARFAGLSQDSAEAACRALKRSEISCIAIRN